MTDLSIVIPALNEEGFLPGLLGPLRRELDASGHSYELLLADNGSSDNTAAVARAFGVKVVECAGLTVAGARNRAAHASSGDVLVFLDADMVVRAGWGKAVRGLWKQLTQRPGMVIGGSVAAPPDAGWIGRVWFPAKVSKARTVRYVGSAHMIVTRAHFEALRGFDSRRETAEDYDFCARTWGAGGSVVEMAALPAFHRGVPKTFSDFFERELWHGGAGGLADLMVQRVSWLGVIWILLHLLMLGAVLCIVLGAKLSGLVVLLVSVLGVLMLPLLAAIRRTTHGGSPPFPPLVVLYFVYLWARAIALVKVALRRSGSHSGRTART